MTIAHAKMECQVPEVAEVKKELEAKRDEKGKKEKWGPKEKMALWVKQEKRVKRVR